MVFYQPTQADDQNGQNQSGIVRRKNAADTPFEILDDAAPEPLIDRAGHRQHQAVPGEHDKDRYCGSAGFHPRPEPIEGVRKFRAASGGMEEHDIEGAQTTETV